MKRTVIFLCAFCAVISFGFAGKGFAADAAKAEKPYYEEEQVFEFNADKHPSNHASTIAQMPNGDLLATWFGGAKEGMPDVAIWTSRKSAKNKSWTKPSVLIDEPGVPEGNSLLFTDSKGVVWLFFVRKYDPKWDAWDKTYLYVQTSKDGGVKWTAPRKLQDKMGWMVRNNVTELPGGRLLLPIYLDSSPMQCMLWLSKDGFKTWEEKRVPLTKPESSQPTFVWLGGEKLLMMARNKGIQGKIWSASSDDLGGDWYDVKKTKLSNPDSGINMIRLKSGAIVLAYNDSGFYRTPLTIALSEDGGKTWPYRKNIETDKKEYSYPFMIQTKDGRVHLVYTADDRRIIKHAEFNEAWLRSK
ncbi:MAG TPA: exo-alpha-sialidase [bacterium]|nr:exo-alpha-sialidase [bacterium]